MSYGDHWLLHIFTLLLLESCSNLAPSTQPNLLRLDPLSKTPSQGSTTTWGWPPSVGVCVCVCVWGLIHDMAGRIPMAPELSSFHWCKCCSRSPQAKLQTPTLAGAEKRHAEPGVDCQLPTELSWSQETRKASSLPRNPKGKQLQSGRTINSKSLWRGSSPKLVELINCLQERFLVLIGIVGILMPCIDVSGVKSQLGD